MKTLCLHNQEFIVSNLIRIFFSIFLWKINIFSANDQASSVAIQHHVTGAVPVRLNASRMPNVKYSSNESIDSIHSHESDPQEIIDTTLIATHQTAREYSKILSFTFQSWL